MPNDNGKNNNGKEPILVESKTLYRNPFVTQEIDAKESLRLQLNAKLQKQYVPSGAIGYYPWLKTQPATPDDITEQFGLQVYDQMLRDPVCFASSKVFTLGLLANGYEIVPSLSKEESDYDVAKKMCDFVTEQITNLDISYPVVLENHLEAFIYGCSINEKSFEYKDGIFRLKDVRDKPLTNALFVVDSFNNTIGLLTQRFPGQMFVGSTYIPIDFSAGTSALNQRLQDKSSDTINLSERFIGLLPRHLFSVLTNSMRYGDERGHSGYRAAYTAWLFKQQTIAEYLSWLAKFATPIIVGTTAPNESGQNLLNEETGEVLIDDTTGLPRTKTPQQVMSDALQLVANGSTLAIPYGAKVDIAWASGDGSGFIKAIAMADMQMAVAITSQYLATMEGQHQSRASSETHQDMLSLGINARKRWLADQQRKEVFTDILKYNFDITGKKIARYIPNLRLGYGDGFPTKASEIAQLMSSGFLDDSQKEGLDLRLGLPKRDTIVLSSGERVTPSQSRQIQDGERRFQFEQESVRANQENKNTNPNAMKATHDNSQKTIVVRAPDVTVNLPPQTPPDMSKVKIDLNANIHAPIRLPENLMKAQPSIVVQNPTQPRPIVNVQVEPTPIIIKNAVTPPSIQNNINVPIAPPPVVNVTVPQTQEEIIEIERDSENRIKRALKRFIYGNTKIVRQ